MIAGWPREVGELLHAGHQPIGDLTRLVLAWIGNSE
jgi:hypothetical protein